MRLQSLRFLVCVAPLLGLIVAGNAPAFNFLPSSEGVVLRARQPEAVPGRVEYAVVIDAGSSGSRLHLYSWQGRSFKIIDGDDNGPLPPLPLAEPEEVKVSFTGTGCKKNKLTPGVSDGESGVRQVALLIECAQAVAPLRDVDIKRVPVFLFATGGMRLLHLKERQGVFGDLESVLRKSGHRFDPSQSRILSGEEEGVFAWLAVNYRQGHLKSTMPRSLQDSVGIIEMGGASAQVAFKPRDPDMLAGQYRVTLGNGIDENIYTQSHLYFGMNEAHARLLRVLGVVMLKQHRTVNSQSRAVMNPCMPEGAVHSLDLIDEFSAKQTVELRGSGRGPECRSLLSELLAPRRSVCLTDPRAEPGTLIEKKEASTDAAFSVTVQHMADYAVSPHASTPTTEASTCVAGTVYQPRMEPGEKVVVVGSLVYMWKYFGVTLEDEQDWARTQAVTDAACKKSWATVSSERADDEFATERCFQGSYMVALFEALMFAPIHLTMAEEGYSWTLGAAVAEANSVPVVVQPVVTRIPPQVELDTMKAALIAQMAGAQRDGEDRVESQRLWQGVAVALSVCCILLTGLFCRAHSVAKLSCTESSRRPAEVEMVA